MEFCEKIQQLRRQNDMTQEQLAKQLFVSRTAISKWEGGKGYPNIESLKSISNLFFVSIDDLLSSEELINLAAYENRSNLGKVFNLIYGVLDLMAIAFLFLPFFGQPDGTYIRFVPLFQYHNILTIIFVSYWITLLLMIMLGIAELIIQHLQNEKWSNIGRKCSLIVNVTAILIFIATREPYVTTILFLFLIIKGIVLLKQKSMK